MENRKNRELKNVIKALLIASEHENSLSRCCAVKALARIGTNDEKTKQRLIAALLDTDPDVRMDAATVLGDLKLVKATEALLNNLENDPDGDVRIQAVKALSQIQSPETMEPLIRCMAQDGYPHLDFSTDEMEYCASWEIQHQALIALGEIGNPEAAEPIISLLEHDEYEDLQETGFRVLAKLNSDTGKHFLLRQLQNGQRIARRRAAQALSLLPEFNEKNETNNDIVLALSQALSDPEPTVRIYAARTLGKISNPLVISTLILLLSDPDAEVRKEVALVLSDMGGLDVLEKLHELLAKETGSKQRCSIIQILGDIASPASIPVLEPLLDSSDTNILYEAIVALGAIGQNGPKNKIAEILSDKSFNSDIRIQAAKTLGQICKNTAYDSGKKKKVNTSKKENSINLSDPVRILERAVYDSNQQVSFNALSALIEINPDQASEILVGYLRAETNVVADSKKETTNNHETLTEELPEALADMITEKEKNTSTLKKLLSDNQSSSAHSRIENKKSTQANPRKTARIYSARLLGTLPKPDKKIIKALVDSINENNPDLYREILLALGRIGDQRGLPAVIKGLAIPHADIRLTALDALGRIKNINDITEQIVVLAHDPDTHVRERAIQSLIFSKLPEARKCLVDALEDDRKNVIRIILNTLDKDSYCDEYADLVINLVFKFSGELHTEAAASLRRVNDLSGANHLMDTLNDTKEEAFHWVCIDALGEMFASEPEKA